MSLNLNQVVLAGHLTRTPEVKLISGNQRRVAIFAIAVNRRWKTAEGETKEEAAFIDCEAWGRTAELAGQYLTKGSPVYAEGRLRLDAWQDKEGQRRTRLKVVIDTIQFLSRPGDRPRTAEGQVDAPLAAEPASEALLPAGAEEEPPF
jgi:single-strand DNA-binding protein